jgi:aryl-alcohol dehydrogenase-like predicted oxidoreductase
MRAKPSRGSPQAMSGFGLLPYFSLAAGLLTGKYRRDAPLPADARLRHNKRWANQFLTRRNWDMLGRLEQFCAARGRSTLELAFGWLLARPAVASVIAGATKPEQLKLNVESAAWTPTAEDMAEIDHCASC